MDSRLNFEEEFLVSQRRGFQFPDSWMPGTPQKPVPENSPANQLGRGNWPEFHGKPTGYFQELLNNNGPAQNFSPVEQISLTGRENSGGINSAENRMFKNTDYYAQRAELNNDTLANLLATRNNFTNRTATIGPRDPVPFPNFHLQAENWRHSSSDGFVVPSKSKYNLDLPPRIEAAGAFHMTTSFQSMPATPDQTKKIENQQISILPTCAPDERSIPEKEKQETLIASNGNGVPQDNCVLLQNIVDSSSAIISTPVEGERDFERSSDPAIDLNKTPQKKTPKRRKHRPKVIVEGKPKRTQNSATTKLEDNSSGKRKYVRRKGLTESATEHVDSTKESDPSAGTPAKRKYVRRKGLTKSVTEHEDSTKESDPSARTPAGTPAKRKYIRKKSLKESTNEELDSMNKCNPSAGKNGTAKSLHEEDETKPMTEQANCTSSNPNPGTTGKRKYVRKSGPKASATPQVECTRETDPSVVPAPKSCRRALNFNLENAVDDNQAEMLSHQEMLKGGDATNFNSMKLQNVENSGSTLNTLTRQQSGLALENLQSLAQSSHTSNKKVTTNYVSIPGTAPQLQTKDDQMVNLHVKARNTNLKNADFSQHRYRYGYTHIQQTVQSVSQGKSNLENVDLTKFEGHPVLSNHTEGWESKIDHCHTIEHGQFSTASSMSSSLPPGIFLTDGYINGSIYRAPFQQTSKRQRREDESHAYNYDLKHMMLRYLGQLQAKGTKSDNAKQFTSLRNCRTLDPHFQSDDVARGKSGHFNTLTGDNYVPSTAAGLSFSSKHISSQLHSSMEQFGMSNRLNLIHNIDATTNRNHVAPTTPEKAPILQFGLVGKTTHADVSENKREHGSSRQIPAGKGKMPQEHKLYDYQRSTKARGPSTIKVYSSPIEETIDKFKGLNLDERNNSAMAEDQNALVIYKGAGTVVPYEELQFIKKRKSRPKVDLDPETNRIWNLLMGKESEDTKGTDKEKEKWWKEERRVFRGRVDSFIARMHLVQGDRRFSKWKGSVVDSVIGVFLTQNVSDHLSSSAFMSLAARFPLKSSCMKDCNADETKVFIREPDICETNPNKTFSHPLDNQSSMTLTGLTNYCRNSSNSVIEGRSLMDTYFQSLEEEVLSSQGSFDSSFIQENGGIRSYSGSNSETEDPTTGCKFSNTDGSTLDQIGNSAVLDEFYNTISGSSLFCNGSKFQQSEVTEDQQKSRLERNINIKQTSSFNQDSHYKSQQGHVQTFEVSNHLLHETLEHEAQGREALERFGEECSSSLASTAPGFNRSEQLGQSRGKIIVECNGLPISQNMATTALNTSSGEIVTHQQEVSQLGSHSKMNHLCNIHQEKRNEAFQSQSTSLTTPFATDAVTRMHKNTSSSVANALKVKGRPDDVERMSLLNKNKDIEHKEVQSHAKESSFSSNKEQGENDILKPKRNNAQEQKNNATDWDGLRKEVQANRWKKESKDTMDSLDYEAMRNADVSEISDAIKERGMNNKLAERIKDFLNRLVRDHESVDLEWLREVPPDKAKDYLLSIRGLGLKSVECVRLLTLHHLAFPVDTNVGRIAVRLGWVPLQPLPESLQLHLLELYPILESIQKYLWPRLCKLDQPTLYELHYQMITFGKVFCTKSKPNCNACPLRGECRHFASAFASARLALPGPEEKSITGSTVPMMPERDPVRLVSQMPLPPPEHNLLKAGRNLVNHEPIIEEPATPEPEHTEESHSDIEDACYEDPDEIPTIKLNVEEFTANLEQYMQGKMELQEGDLSKALVALNPEVASIPAPKLKNVSRLRTEHYVYELPDTHPLLENMERREPDDPSPYLLAIWTPGETANSVQLPEQSCRSQEPGRLCDEKTCFACNSVREASAQKVRGTILIPCRTAMRGSFPLNGTYFQVNEVFADHESSLNPIDVPREWIWNLPRRTVYFGTSVSTIFKGLSTEGIQYCFWKGFVCVRGFDQKTRAPRPLMARLHFPASKLAKTKTENKR